MCRELGIAIVCYSPLGRGFFAGYKPEGIADENDFRKVWRKFSLQLQVGVTKIATIALNLFSGWNVQFAPRYHYLSYCATLVSLTFGSSSNIYVTMKEGYYMPNMNQSIAYQTNYKLYVLCKTTIKFEVNFSFLKDCLSIMDNP